MNLPSVIFFINADMNEPLKAKVISQLQINESMTDTEFNARVLADPNYPVNIHLNQLRILVIQQNYQDFTNRDLADVVLFIKQGLVTVEFNGYGPPSITYQIDRLNVFNLLEGIKNSRKSLVCRSCICDCHCNCFSHLPIQLQQMLINVYDKSGVHNANCDNIFNNIEFINRK